MKKQVLFLDARREGYGIDDIHKTMTVGELIAYLQENYDEDTPMYLSHDNGYTYGGITEDRFFDDWVGGNEEEENEEE